jgi:hypothetical protein
LAVVTTHTFTLPFGYFIIDEIHAPSNIWCQFLVVPRGANDDDHDNPVLPLNAAFAVRVAFVLTIGLQNDRYITSPLNMGS